MGARREVASRFNSRLREEATRNLLAGIVDKTVSTHASVRRRRGQTGLHYRLVVVSTHASVRRRPDMGRSYAISDQFQLTPP